MKNLIIFIPSTIVSTENIEFLGGLSIMLSLLFVGMMLLIVGNIYCAIKAQFDKYLFRLYKKDNLLLIFGYAFVLFPLIVMILVFISALTYSLIS